MSKAIFNFGRAVGTLAAALLSVMWVFAMWTPAAGLPLSGFSFAVAFIMSIIAIVGIIASIRGHSAMLSIAFLASFLPVGAVLIQVDLWFEWIGRLDLVLLVAAALIWWGSRTQRHVAED